MNGFGEFFLAPLRDEAVRHSFAAVLALGLSAGPAGVFLILCRWGLGGGALSPAILRGVAIGLRGGAVSAVALPMGGVSAALSIALLSGAVSRPKVSQEEVPPGVFLVAW